MAIKPDYTIGTIAVSSLDTTVVGTGTAWVSADIQPGDTLKVKNLDAIIATVNSNTSITLKEAWTGGALVAGSNYAIRYQPDGSRLTAAVRDLVETINTGPLNWAMNAKPIFILATGQSNVVTFRSFTWTPAPNLMFWNNVQGNATSVGTAFEPPTGLLINPSLAFADRIARENPTTRVYLVNCGYSGQDISHWMTGATFPDVFANIVANVGPALTASNCAVVDTLLWWQGETGGELTTYPADFEAVQSRFAAQPWFPVHTPVVVFGVASATQSTFAKHEMINFNLQQCVTAMGATRLYVNTQMYPSSYWTDNIHLNAEGYDSIGKMAANIHAGRSTPVVQDGKFTPVIEGITTAGVGTYSTQVGRFSRFGKVVMISINLSWSAHTGTGGMTIKGLPYVLPDTRYAAFSVHAAGMNTTNFLAAAASAASGVMLFSNGAALPMDTAGAIIITGFYFAEL